MLADRHKVLEILLQFPACFSRRKKYNAVTTWGQRGQKISYYRGRRTYISTADADRRTVSTSLWLTTLLLSQGVPMLNAGDYTDTGTRRLTVPCLDDVPRGWEVRELIFPAAFFFVNVSDAPITSRIEVRLGRMGAKAFDHPLVLGRLR